MEEISKLKKNLHAEGKMKKYVIAKFIIDKQEDKAIILSTAHLS